MKSLIFAELAAKSAENRFGGMGHVPHENDDRSLAFVCLVGSRLFPSDRPMTFPTRRRSFGNEHLASKRHQLLSELMNGRVANLARKLYKRV